MREFQTLLDFSGTWQQVMWLWAWGGSSLDNNAEHCCLKGIGDVHESDPNAHIFVIIFQFGLMTPKVAAGKIIRFLKPFIKRLLTIFDMVIFTIHFNQLPYLFPLYIMHNV